ncbi:HAD family hydrolase [Actinomyces sp. zg296]|uniref:HAD family hydrolase n=1 Tax=Actinomyces sp. zg296 TaxID=2609289 RepID=UPI00135A569D|nr:HAD family hydrolase [Actinomyces sp. zg296]
MSPLRLPPPTRAVLVDIDGVLVDHRRASDRASYLWASGLEGWELGPRETAELWEAIDRRHFARYQAGELDFSGQLRERVREFVPGGSALSDAEADSHMAAYRAIYRRLWRAYDDVPSFLARLEALRAAREQAAAAGGPATPLAVAYLTNGDAPSQEEKLAAVGARVAGWEMLASAQMGATKPDPAIFFAACARLGVAPAEALMIGDDVGADVDGALAVGMPVVHLRRGDQGPSRAVPTVTSLDEIEF